MAVTRLVALRAAIGVKRPGGRSTFSLAANSLLGALLLTGIGVLDAVTGELRLSILYVIVIVSMTWINGLGNGMVFAAVSTLAIVLANATEGDRSIGDPRFLVSVGTDLLVFGFCVVGTNSLREVLFLERVRRQNLARYLPYPVAERLAEEGLGAQKSRLYAATIMFVDIRGFTRLARVLAPANVFDLLQSYRQIIALAVKEWGGFVDKYVGDGALIVFGVAEPSADNAGRAVSAGLEILSRLSQWNADQAAIGHASLHIGIGIHSGDVIAGAIGDEERLEFTVVGDTVNLAARIEDLTRDLGLPLLISEAVYRSLPLALREAHDWAHLCVPQVRGVAEPVVLAYPTMCLPTDRRER